MTEQDVAKLGRYAGTKDSRLGNRREYHRWVQSPVWEGWDGVHRRLWLLAYGQASGSRVPVTT